MAEYRSNRNRAKSFRKPRVITDAAGHFQRFHPLDMMNFPKIETHHGHIIAVPRLVNTTGCYGTPSTWGTGRISIVNKKIAPGKTRSAAKRKNGCKLAPSNHRRIEVDFQRKSTQQLLGLRGDILMMRLLSDTIPQHFEEVLNQITRYLMSVLSREEVIKMFQTDSHRESSTRGMLKGGKIQFQQIKSINQRISRGILNMGGKN